MSITKSKKVEEGLRQSDEGEVPHWSVFKKEIRSWYKSK
jgi:hypothetical protein